MAATLRDVAEMANVSESTVSRVVRGISVVSEPARKRVENAIATLGYRPNAAARSIRTGQSHAVGFVVPDISNSFYATVFQGAQRLLHERGYELMLATSDGDRERERNAIDSLLSRGVDGLVLSLVDENPTDLSERLDGIPTVLLDRESKTLSVDAVLSDHRAGMRAAMDHLASLGHSRIALLTGTPSLYTSRSRQEQFLASAAEHGMPADGLRNVFGDRSVEAGERRTLQFMAETPRPTALIAGSNQLLRGMLLGLNHLGLECPRDVSIIACEDSDICEIYKPNISAVRRDVSGLGRQVADLLLERLTAAAHVGVDPFPPPPVVRMLSTEFVVRGSTGTF